ncbi:hypothetical protein BGX34_012002 [Mortierella sp. NVP85]|nr:hypothetical protein BGX34_012002 [Mortierella sp. NVP85]
MTRGILLGLAGLIALSTAVVVARTHDHETSDEPNNQNDNIVLPVFKPTNIKAPFLEQFAYGWSDAWVASNATKASADGEIFSYVGRWAVEEPHIHPGMKHDFGLVAKTPAAHHAISASLPEVVDNKGKTLVVQYEVKAQNGVVCGGAYMKLLTESPKGIKFKEFSDETPYTIMFGPDKCGDTDKVHFIFRHRNPITDVYEEKHLQSAPSSKLNPLTSLYTLIVRPDQTFEVMINGEVASSGSLLENFQPPVNPPKQIDDPKDSKPANWVEEAKIPDPKARKPEDWDEDAPARILDENAKKPDDWLEDEGADIPDPEATKPEDWNDEEDGDWIPPSIPNPKCQDNGCGPWTRPFISNPAYKGKWSPPLIDNPAYKGVWAPRKIPNPGYFEDLQPSSFEKIGAIGFEIWTMQNDILFDNIYIGHSVEDAKALAAETWEIKYSAEKKQEEGANPPPKPELSYDWETFKKDPVGVTLEHLREFYELARDDPMHALDSRPFVTYGLTALLGLLCGLVLIVVGLMSGSSTDSDLSQVAQDKKTDGPDAGDKEEEKPTTPEGQSKEGLTQRKTNVVDSNE